MPFDTEARAEVLKQFKVHESDTGSTQVQAALLTHRINQLQDHFKLHKKDHTGRLGLLKMVGKRRRLMAYLKKHDLDAYRKLVQDLGLRK